MSLLPLCWVVIDAPLNRAEHRINDSFARVMWVADEGSVLSIVDGPDACKNWQIPSEHLRQFSPWPAGRFD